MSVHFHKKWTPPQFLFNAFISVITSVLCRLTHSPHWCQAALGHGCPSPQFSVVLRDIFRAVWLRCFGEALSSLFLDHPLPEDIVTCPTERGQFLHNPESIEFSQKCLIKMLTLEIYSAVGIATPCAGQDVLNPHSEETLLMVHGDSLCVCDRTQGTVMQTGLEGWCALLTPLTLACPLPCVAGWPCVSWQHLPSQGSALADGGSQQQAQLGPQPFPHFWWPTTSPWCGWPGWASHPASGASLLKG